MHDRRNAHYVPEEDSGIASRLYPRTLRRGHIRLLKLCTANGQGTLSCSLTETLLSPDLDYYALSYAWNGTFKQRTILVDSFLLDVTQSAYDALLSIRNIMRRKDLQDLLIWIDAICINQVNVVERNEQVDQMGPIYRGANVLIYLGPETKELDNELRTVTSSPSEDQYDSSIRSASAFQRRSEAAIKMFSRAWFDRVWVVQEAVLGKSTMLICGSYMCPFAELHKAIKVLETQSGNQLSRNESFRNIMDAVALIRRLRLKRDKGDHDGITREYSTARVLQCTDVRDHCYGLHGMHPHSDTPLPLVDYDCPVAVVYTFAAHWVIEQCGLHALCMEHADVSQEDTDPPLVPGLPSWVPDWTMRGTPRYYPWWMYSAGGNSALQYKPTMFSNGGTTLLLQGVIIDTVSSRWSVPDLEPFLKSPQAFADMEPDLFPASCTRDHAVLADHLLAVQRTVCIDLAYKYDMDATTGFIWTRWNDLPGFIDTAKGLFDGSLSSSEVDFDTNTTPRDTDVILAFEHGHIGLGRQHVQPGDVAVIFPGVFVPFTLRKRANGITYQMIGPTYLDGFMNGEAVHALDRGEFSLQSFEID